ncbi:MAG: diphthine--ammonia ligase [Abditibacteriaceae bacterium]
MQNSNFQKPKAIFCWSGGKDSAFCLRQVLVENQFDVKYLMTTINSQFSRVSMHGVRESLLDAQAASIGISLLKMFVCETSNEAYEQQMEKVLLKAKSEGVEYVIFGDIFLEDLRAYRENNLAKFGMKAVFPLWKKDTKVLINEFLEQGFKTITCCVSDKYLDEDFTGQIINTDFLSRLPAEVDPCGENGEFHTFCFDGPIFKNKIDFTIGEKLYKSTEYQKEKYGFWYCDLF